MATDLRSLYVALNEMTDMPHILFLEIKDDFFREDASMKYVEKWKESFSEGEVRFCTAAELLAKRQTLLEDSFFLKASLLVLSDLSLRGKKNDEFLSLLQGNSNKYYFFIPSSDPPLKAFSELLKEKGTHLALEPIKPWERGALVEGWIQQYVKKQGKRISREASSALATAFPQDRRGLAQELSKIVLFSKDEPEIHLKDVEAISSLETKTSSWNLLEALLSQDVKGVVQALTYLDDWNEIALLRFLRGQIEKFLLAENASSFRTKTQMKQYNQACGIGTARLLTWIEAFEMHEVAIKSGEKEATFEDLLPLFLSLLRKP